MTHRVGWCRGLTVLQGQFLQDARATLSRAQSQTQDAFQRYTACMEAEARARREVILAEQHRDELSKCHGPRAREQFTKGFIQCLHYSHEHRQLSVRKMGIQTPPLSVVLTRSRQRISTSSILAPRRCQESSTYTAPTTQSTRRKIIHSSDEMGRLTLCLDSIRHTILRSAGRRLT